MTAAYFLSHRISDLTQQKYWRVTQSVTTYVLKISFLALASQLSFSVMYLIDVGVVKSGVYFIQDKKRCWLKAAIT